MTETNPQTPSPTTPAPATTTLTTSSGSKRQRAKSAAEVESGRRKFRNLTNGRVGRCLNAIRVVANLAKLTASKDQMSEADVKTIMDVIDAEVQRCRQKLLSGATGQQLDVEFDLDMGRAP